MSVAKIALKNLCCACLPLALAVGCAQNRAETAPAYSALPERAVTPTSDQAAERVYSGQEGFMRTPAPSGVATDDWTLNQNISALFMENKKLAPPPSQVTAVVDQKEHGVVHLSGHIVNTSARRRVIDAVSKVPGVTRVDDHQLIVGAEQPTGKVDFQSPP
jgi:hypothetical protein